MTVDLPPESFERQVQDCLVHLYDFTELQANPLAGQIAPGKVGRIAAENKGIEDEPV